MKNSIKLLIESRVSTNYYDTSRLLADSEIEELVSLATRAPSAYNLQNWKFIAVRSHEAKARLKAVCFGQQKVVDAPVTFIICGTRKRMSNCLTRFSPRSTLASWIHRCSMAGWLWPSVRIAAIRSCSATRPSVPHPWRR
ncbi:MAG: nitroreductase family protein [Pseudomonas sp.]